MREMNPHPKKMDSNSQSPGALIEVLAKAIKPMESEQQATSELIS
jgi:hypothetical protein